MLSQKSHFIGSAKRAKVCSILLASVDQTHIVLARFASLSRFTAKYEQIASARYGSYFLRWLAASRVCLAKIAKLRSCLGMKISRQSLIPYLCKENARAAPLPPPAGDGSDGIPKGIPWNAASKSSASTLAAFDSDSAGSR